MKIVAKPIEMIAVFDENGKPKPIRFKIKESDSNHVISVDKIISTEVRRPAGMEAYLFVCQSEIEGVLKLYELIYRVKQHLWELYKI